MSGVCNNLSVRSIHVDTNSRISDRNVPSHPMRPYLDVRPAPTKYSHFPVVDPRAQPDVPLLNYATHDVHLNFAPGTGKSPWSGFVNNINEESELRNQIYALQRCSQCLYVPSSTSDLYNYEVRSNISNDHAMGLARRSVLFAPPQQFNSFDPNPNSNIIGISLFNNSTRAQLKEMGDDC